MAGVFHVSWKTAPFFLTAMFQILYLFHIFYNRRLSVAIYMEPAVIHDWKPYEMEQVNKNRKCYPIIYKAIFEL